MASNTTTEVTALSPWGYHVAQLHLLANVIAELLHGVKSGEYAPVLRTVGAAEKDEYRQQSRLQVKATKLSDAMQLLHQELCCVVRMHKRSYIPTVYHFMKSKAGGCEQDPHQDYTPAAIAKVATKQPGTIPCSMIIALDDGTKLKVFDSCYRNLDHARSSVIELQPGWYILFRDDLFHGGMA